MAYPVEVTKQKNAIYMSEMSPKETYKYWKT